MTKTKATPEKRKRGRPRGPRHAAEYAQLGAPPEDPLEVVSWAGRALAVAMHKIATDDTLDERLRRQELRATAKVLVGLVPAERLLGAERTIRRQNDVMDRTTAEPELQDVSAQPTRPLRFDPT